MTRFTYVRKAKFRRRRYDKQSSSGVNPAAAAPTPTQSPAAAASLKVGDTKTENGITYRFNEHHRWELAEQPGSQGEGDPAPGAPSDDKSRGKAHKDFSHLGSHADRHKFAVSQLDKVFTPAADIARWFHSQKAYQGGGERCTAMLSQRHAGQFYAWLRTNVGQQIGGGYVVDFGQGRYGFASNAGAMVLWPPDDRGQMKVGYTTATPMLARAAGLEKQQTGPAGTSPAVQSAPGQPATPAAKRRKAASIADNFADYMRDALISESQRNLKAVGDAIGSGRIKNPAELKRLLATARRLHERGNIQDDDHPALQEALRRKANRDPGLRAPTWPTVVKDKAEQWGMSPQDYEGVANDLWREFEAYHGEREAAKIAARQTTGLTAADINRLENQGYDSGSDHPKLKHLDDIGRSMASQYPALGWGRGFEEDSGSSDDFDYGENLWALIREGAKPKPSKTAPEFLEHVDQFLGRGWNPDDDADYRPREDDEAIHDEEYDPWGEKHAAAVPFARKSGIRGHRWRYLKRGTTFHGLRIAIECRKGESRHPGWPPLTADYGCILQTSGADGEHVDCFIGPDLTSETVVVIDQVKADGTFDEHKCLIGWPDGESAVAAYMENYPDDWQLGQVMVLGVAEFQEWLEGGRTVGPLAEEVRRYGRTWTKEDEEKHPRDEGGQWAEASHDERRSEADAKGAEWSLNRRKRVAKEMFEDFSRTIHEHDPRLAKVMVSAAHAVVNHLSQEALLRLVKNVSRVQFHATAASINAELLSRGNKRRTAVAFYSYEDGSLHLNGGSDTGERTSFTLAEIYAHEFGHAIDTNGTASLSQYWESAWLKELANDQLTPEASKDTVEGWGEFAQVAILTPDEASSNFPKCFEIWKNLGLTK